MKQHLKNLSLVILLLLTSIKCIKAQTEKAPSLKVPDYIQNADYVFEGTAIDVTGYWTTVENGNRVIYTSLLVEVSNVFKGNGIKKGLIQVIVQGGSAPLENDPELIANSDYYGSHDERIPIFTQKGTKGIIFGKSVPNKIGFNWNKKLENIIVIEHKKALIYCVECSYEKFDNLQTDWGTFNNLFQLRKSIRSFNLETDFIDRTDSIEDSIATLQKEQELKKIEEDNIKMSKIVEEAKAREALMIQGKLLAAQEAEAKKKVNPNLKLAAGGNLNLDLRNFTYSTVSGLNYVEFDVYVWGTQPTFLEGTLFRLNFDKHAFGDSSYVKNYLTASKGTSFNNINYKIYGPFYIEDSVVAINFSTNDSLVRPNRIAVSTTPLQLVHLKFRVKNCQATAKMKFVDPVICDILTGFKLNSNDSISGPVQSYDNVFRTDYSPIPLCPITKITGFSPSIIRAGTNEVLTITGTNFGATRGNGQILFADADSIGSYFKRCDSIDYVSWTNTEIKVKVPSLVLSDTLNPTAGSGIFKIVTNQGFRDSTTTKLDVQYSLRNSTSAG